MLSDPQVLNYDATHTESYALSNPTPANGSYRKVAAQPLSQPHEMTISHTPINGKAGKSNRHLVQFKRTELDALLQPAYVTTNLTVTCSDNSAITAADALEELNKLVSFLTAGASDGQVDSTLVTALLQGQS